MIRQLARWREFERTVSSLDALLATLNKSEWSALAQNKLTVHEMVGHLIGIERHVGAQIGLWPLENALDTDHVATVRRWVQWARDHDANTVLCRWRDSVAVVLHQVRAVDLNSNASFHGFPFTLREWLIVRTFELWTHEEDVCRATGRALAAPEADRLRLMTALAVSLIGPVLSACSGCRMAAARCSLDRLQPHIEGDLGLADDLPAAVAALALD